MTPDQSERLVASADNCAALLKELTGYEGDPIETFIEIFNGKADDLIEGEPTMPRGRKPKVTAAPADVPNLNSPPSHVAVPQDRTQLITDWQQAAAQLADVKAKEHALRQALVASCFDGNKLEGSETVAIGWGYSLKATKELNYAATNKNSETEVLIAELEKRGEAATELAGKLISWKPDVSKPAYREVYKLAQQYNDSALLEALHKAVTIKPGMPQLEFVSPQAAEAPPTYQLETTGKVFTDGSDVKW